MKQVDFTSIPLGERPAAHAWQVIIEQASQGQATIYQADDGSYAVQFADEEEATPFAELVYSRTWGLYDRRKFPDMKEL